MYPSQITFTLITQKIKQDSNLIVWSCVFRKSLPSTYHTSILRLQHFHLRYWGKKCQVVFQHIFLHFFCEKLMQLHTSGFSHQTKFTEHLETNCLSTRWNLLQNFFCPHLAFALSRNVKIYPRTAQKFMLIRLSLLLSDYLIWNMQFLNVQ